ncbi:MAG: hypothetical protein HYU64_15170 [Armatimonadetes bacterium]|nr:hypothetical protein [Armatimonadota bacterium]
MLVPARNNTISGHLPEIEKVAGKIGACRTDSNAGGQDVYCGEENQPPVNRTDPPGSARAASDFPGALTQVSLCPPIGGPIGATLAACSRAILDAFLFELRRTPRGWELANQMRREEKRDYYPLYNAGSCRQGSSPLDLYKAIVNGLARTPALSSTDDLLIRRAMDGVPNYLDLDNRPLVSLLSHPQTRSAPPPDTRLEACFSPEAEAVQVDQLRWRGASSYAESRLGPVVTLLDSLEEGDRTRFSNLSWEKSLGDLPDIEKIEAFNLPLSSWSKEIHRITHGDGSRTLLFSAFLGKILMRHFELLVKKRLYDQQQAPQISVLESESTHETHYGSLRAFFREKGPEMGPVNVLVFGYDYALKESWKPYHCSSIESPGARWSSDIYALPGGKRVAVLRSKDSWYGEILGENLRRLLPEHPEVSHVFMGGSGGSIHVRDPLQFVFPKRIVGPSGVEVSNVLSDGAESTAHESVVSPLVETPGYLSGLAKRQVTTVDMEMGFLAEALAGRNVHLGVGVLVSDFPVERPVNPGAGLAAWRHGQDPLKVGPAKKMYAEALFNYLTLGKPPYGDAIESHTGKSLAEMSGENMEREMAEMVDMTSEERTLFERLCRLTPTYTFRMTTGRLAWGLEDGALLSTGQVARFKNADVLPITPGVEDKMYGAYEYTFGTIGFGDGDSLYGKAEVKIRPEAWRNRSWATYASGWAALHKAGDGSENVRESPLLRLAHWVTEPRKGERATLVHKIREGVGFWFVRHRESSEGGLSQKFRKYVCDPGASQPGSPSNSGIVRCFG